MNRLSPWIRRNPRPALAFAAPAGSFAQAPQAPEAGWSEELRLFATAWLGGLIFFGTFLA